MRQRKQQFSFVKHPGRNIFSPQTLAPCGLWCDARKCGDLVIACVWRRFLQVVISMKRAMDQGLKPFYSCFLCFFFGWSEPMFTMSLPPSRT